MTKFVGGAEISLYYLIVNLDKTRYQPFLLTGGPGTFLDKMRAANIKVWSQDFPWLSRRRPWIYMRWGRLLLYKPGISPGRIWPNVRYSLTINNTRKSEVVILTG